MLKRKRGEDRDIAFFLRLKVDDVEESKGDEMTLPPTDGLSMEQIEALHKVARGKRVFITGSAGTGKSFLIDKIVEMLDLNDKKHIITALTGVAASEIMGMTLHSASCVNEDIDVTKQLHWLRKNKEVVKRFEADVWIVDEISMVNIVILKKIHQVAKALRGSEKPFGGIQFIVVGDFLQLPPITRDTSRPPFAFEYPEWAYLVEEVVLLEEAFRQKDETFLAILNEMRMGTLSDYHATILKENYQATVRKSMYKVDSVTKAKESTNVITKLYPKNTHVNEENEGHYKSLSSSRHKFFSSCSIECWDSSKRRGRDKVPVESKEYTDRLRHGDKRIKILSKKQKEDIEAIDYPDVEWSVDTRDHEAMTTLSNFIVNLGLPTTHKLKVGLQVMLRCNLSPKHNLVNGTRGTIVGFTKYASTSTFQDVKEHCESFEGFMRDLTRAAPVEKGGEGYPVVQFPGIRIVVMSNRWSVPLRSRGPMRWYACYETIPLSIAAAITIHKSQGLSLDEAAVSMDEIFAEGQCYVAFSRIRSLDGLTLISFNPSAVKAHPSAVRYYNVITQLKKEGIPLTSLEIQERFLRTSTSIDNK